MVHRRGKELAANDQLADLMACCTTCGSSLKSIEGIRDSSFVAT